MEWVDILKRLRARITHHFQYRKTWGTPVGQDCISLDTSLCRWLGDRLIFLSEHTHGFPAFTNYSYETWQQALKDKGAALRGWGNRYEHTGLDLNEEKLIYANAQEALRWVADHLDTLWD